jgi:hypothetical protein
MEHHPDGSTTAQKPGTAEYAEHTEGGAGESLIFAYFAYFVVHLPAFACALAPLR